jgi:hypothetical protein
MTERTNTPLNHPPSEQDRQEFQRKFDEFVEGLSNKEQLQAASLVVLAAQEEGIPEAEQVGENEEADSLSDNEMAAFNAKLNSFHDSLPEGQHQILDAITAEAFVHSIPEDERDDVQGNAFLWTKPITSNYWLTYWTEQCGRQSGTLKYRWTNTTGTRYYGCWR